MFGPLPSSQGVTSVDFFSHGLVAFGGGVVNVFAVVELCLAAGFGVQTALVVGFSVAAAQSAGFKGSLALSAGFDEEQDLSGTVQTCDG